MRFHRVLMVLVGLMLITAPASALSLQDILKGTQESALNLFIKQIMPIDGWGKVEVGDAIVVKGQSFWNPDYYIVFEGGKVKFWGPIPTDVDVKVIVYKVYFGLIAFYYGEYEDIWWKKEKIGDGWIGGFFVSGFDWKWFGGESDVKCAYIAYNSPSIDNLAAEDVNLNLTAQASSDLKIEIVDWDSIKKVQIGGAYLLWR